MEKCELCPRKCGVDRATKRGYCGQTNEIRVARAAPHMWEEPCISGKNGSGTIFFCGCTLGCVYCQNAAISRCDSDIRGKAVGIGELADVFLRLQQIGVHNINLVTPTMFAPSLRTVVDIARASGLTIPIVYNTSGYEAVEGLAYMADKTDIYLPDFKYISPDLAKRYSHAEDYPEHATTSLAYMVKRIGRALFDDNGMMKRGIIVRHLLLPGQLTESIRVLDYLFGEYGNDIYYSLMSQYTPMSSLDREAYPELDRGVTSYEYNKLVEHAISLGLCNGFIQDVGSAKESFIPDFN